MPCFRAPIIFNFALAVICNFCLMPTDGRAAADDQSGTSTGYLFLGPMKETSGKSFKDGATLHRYNRIGVVVTEDSDSPWYQATWFEQGSTLKDSDGNVIQDVALCESTDADGDLSWCTRWANLDGSFTLQMRSGTGKWEDITGSGQLQPAERQRADNHSLPRWALSWKIGASSETPTKNYTASDRGLSFHGPHITESTRTLKNGTTLVVSNQSGVLLSEDPAAESPRNFATCFDRGTTIKTESGNGDVMLLEDTDPDGDMVWLYHEWWYGKGPGIYRFIGGTGKWRGIVGEGKTLGQLRGRTDDHFMLKSEMHWRIDKVD